jgi:hypothetical protein
MRAAALLCLIALAAGCAPEFDEEQLVKDLRILGIRAEPPELRLGGPTPSIAVDALVVDPTAPDRLHDWELWLCSADGPLCDAASASALLRRDRTRLDQIRHSLVLDEEMLRRAHELYPQLDWIPLTLELRVLDDGGPTVRGVKRLRLLGSTAELRAQNPRITTIKQGGALLGDPISLAPCRQVVLSIWIRDPGVGHSLDLYTSRGTADLTSPPLDMSTFDFPNLAVAWDPCSPTGPPTGGAAFLWLVLRDGMGGIDWAEVRGALSP